MNILRSAIHRHLFPFIVGAPVVGYRKEYCPLRQRWASFEGFSASMMGVPRPALFPTLRLGSSHPRASLRRHGVHRLIIVEGCFWSSRRQTSLPRVRGLGYDSAWFRSLTSSRRFHCWACHVVANSAMMPPGSYRCGAHRVGGACEFRRVRVLADRMRKELEASHNDLLWLVS